MSAMIAPSRSMQGPSGGNVGLTSSGGQFRDIIPKGYQLGQLGKFTPEQSQLFRESFSHLGPDSWLGRMARGETGDMEEMEQPAWRDFQSALGALSSRLSGGAGGGGGQQASSLKRSSGAQNLGSQAAQDFAMALKEQRSGLRSNALRELLEMSNMLLGQQPFEKFLTEKPQKQPSWLSQAGLSLAGGIGSAGGQLGTLYGAKKLGIF